MIFPDRGDQLIRNFQSWLAYFETNCPFRRYGQFEFYRQTIDRRLELGSAAAAATDDKFQRTLYSTLMAWGIGARRSRLKSFKDFARILSGQVHALAQFDTMRIDDPRLEISASTDALWALITKLSITDNAATLVPVTKALHHLLPDLVVPMDREYTQVFFGWHNPKFQYGQRGCFTEAFSEFARIARAVQPSKFVNGGWNSSRTKVLDNGLIGLVRWARDNIKNESG